ncbi:MAG: CTP synthase [Alphaproteobacteria bacterium]
MSPKFIFITGGVVSSLGKGLASASLGAVLQARGFKVRLRKLDPYLNVDPGTMSPYQHGECYVTEDGAETDLDLGHYERFTGVDAKKSDNVTTGRLYLDVIREERKGDYDGGTVQVIPHITDAIKRFIGGAIEDEDFVICEIGGTVGDIESLPFLEAIRQYANEAGRANTMFIHVTLLPYIAAAGEMKTKPTQHSVKELLSVGIQPDLLLCRAEQEIPIKELSKIALFCNVSPQRVIPALDASSIYDVPLNYHHAGLDRQVLDYFNLDKGNKAVDLSVWEEVSRRIHAPEGAVEIVIVGKYIDLKDAYKSLNEALLHGGIANKTQVRLRYLSAEQFETEDAASLLDGSHAILVPGGFGERGVEGKIKAIHYARTRHIPYFGICFGMQMAVVEFSRNVIGLQHANSTEVAPDSANPVVGLLSEWMDGNKLQKRSVNDDRGGSMRLGAYECKLQPRSKVADAYGGASYISERHRHRYEVNVKYKDALEQQGMRFVGMSPDGELPEIVEIEDHPWFVGVQFHPELKSRPFAPHPLFESFVAAAIKQSRLV